MDEITPLFAIEAEQLILSGFLEEAIALCNKGLEVFPDYPTAKVILARAYNLIGNKEKSEIVLAQAKSENYGKTLDKFNFNETPQIIENEEISQEVNQSNDSINEEIEASISVKNSFENEISNLAEMIDYKDDFEPNDLNNFNDEFKNLIDSVTTSLTLDAKIEFEENNNNINTFKSEQIENSIFTKIAEETFLDDLPITNTLSKILTKNKDAFFNQEDFSEKIFKIENSINNKIISEERVETPNIQQVKIKIKKENSENDSMKLLVMSLISTRFIKDKNNHKVEKQADELPVYTETMAKIFTAQGAKDKAINIYRKLMINEPSKKDYYHSQINKIK